MAVFLLLAGMVVVGYMIFHNIFVKGAVCKSNVKLHGKTVIVTGSNTGIGKMTALDLARRGARVILACRNKQRAEAALADIKRESGSNEVVFMHLDLGSLKSVRTFAETFLKTERRLDLLINNAGIYMQGSTEDGLGMMFGVNYIGHFLLTNLLLDRLKECGPSRVVNVASLGHNFGKIDFNCLSTHKELGVGESATDVFNIYCNSKLCNVVFTHELAKRLKDTNVTCYSLHPGIIETELGRYANSAFLMLLKPISMLFFKNSVAGSQTTLHCALQEGLEPLSGCYFSNCTVRNVYPKARDDAVAKKLWEVSESLCGLL
ncbi:dehydrogenase/reductase SDR family member 13 [Oncorhynchus kisutch]|uniref:Dehydrogenase/reductase (SDR family) member 13a, duplicate 3 n=1 Tax=Oncorhynchus kisutch TaxID=8019 RepID=A0A8C7D6E3_ONCKI|nr:dehydrogenase/reductase SDR family member 13 [Oncorhynchus kisutch]